MIRPERLAGDVQVYGALSAASVVARYAAKVEEAMAAVAEEESAAIAAMTLLARQALRPLGGLRRPERLVLPAVAPGGIGVGSLWLHLPGPPAEAPVELTGSDLASGAGAVIPASAVRFSPRPVETVPAGSRQEIRISVEVPAGQPAGRYHGWVFASACPESPLAVVQPVAEEKR